MEVEFGNMDWSDHICAYKVSFSMRRRQGCEENVAAVGQGWQLPPPPPSCNMSEQSPQSLTILNASLVFQVTVKISSLR